jgi:RNA polymerase sigma-70 factor, ECF subfamily
VGVPDSVNAARLSARLEDALQPMDRNDQDDVWLIRRVANGDRDALAVLYHRHAGVVLAQVTLAVGELALSEEILQDTMLAVWHGAASFRGESAVRSWIIAIARRQARDRLRHRPVRATALADLAGLPAPEAGPEEAAIEHAEAEVIADALGQLRGLHREVLGLVFGAGLTLAETAAVLEVPVGTAKSRLSAARAALTRALAEKGHTPMSHLSLEELIAVARGEPVAPRAAGHLAVCRGCAGEAGR